MNLKLVGSESARFSVWEVEESPSYDSIIRPSEPKIPKPFLPYLINHNQSPTYVRHSTNDPKPTLLTLRTESRNQIYSLVLQVQESIQIAWVPKVRLEREPAKHPNHLAIFRTSKQLYTEAAPVFYSINNFAISTSECYNLNAISPIHLRGLGDFQAFKDVLLFMPE